jgi:hypothetical protein
MYLSPLGMDRRLGSWEDKWFGNVMLREQYSILYNIVRHKDNTLAKVMESSPPNVSFRRNLIGLSHASWNALLQHLDSVHVMQGSDQFRWNLNESGKFLMDSMYKDLIQPDILVDNNKKI